jgi:hypothetical protein
MIFLNLFLHFFSTPFKASNIQPYIRYLQYEIRKRNYDHCSNIFEQLIGNFKSHPEVLAFIFKEYLEFVDKVGIKFYILNNFLKKFFIFQHRPSEKERLQKFSKDSFESITYTRTFYAVYLQAVGTDQEKYLEESIETGLSKALQVKKKKKKISDFLIFFLFKISEQEMLECLKISKNFIRSAVIDIETIRRMERK